MRQCDKDPPHKRGDYSWMAEEVVLVSQMNSFFVISAITKSYCILNLYMKKKHLL